MAEATNNDQNIINQNLKELRQKINKFKIDNEEPPNVPQNPNIPPDISPNAANIPPNTANVPQNPNIQPNAAPNIPPNTANAAQNPNAVPNAAQNISPNAVPNAAPISNVANVPPNIPRNAAQNIPPNISPNAVPNAQDNDVFCNFLNIIINEAIEAKTRGDNFKNKGDIAATLINYTLAFYSYDLIIKFLQQNNRQIAQNQTLCNQTIESLQNKQKEVGVNITYLQNLLKNRLNSSQGSQQQGDGGTNDEDDEIDCSIVKHISLTGKNCLYFDDVVGLSNVKSEIKNLFIYPLIYSNLYPKLAKGILLYGLPGVGKTFIIKAAVNELQSKDLRVIFYAPTGAELKGKYVGESEKKIAAYFKCASEQATRCENTGNMATNTINARNAGNMATNTINAANNNNNVSSQKYLAVLFIDEIEAIGGDRNEDTTGLMTNTVNMLLQKMDGISALDNVVVIAATNFPWKLDAALMRRFTNQICITLPTSSDIYQLMLNQLKSYLNLGNLELKPPQKQQLEELKPTKAKLEPDICNAPLCERTAPSASMNIFEILNISPDLIKEYSYKLEAEYFSNSDIVRFMSKIITEAANTARKHGIFRKITYNGIEAYFSTLNENNVFTYTNDIIRLENIGNKFLTIGGKTYMNINLIPQLDSNLIKNFCETFIAPEFLDIQQSENERTKKMGQRWAFLNPFSASYRNSINNQNFELVYKLSVQFTNQMVYFLYGVSTINLRELQQNNITFGETEINTFLKVIMNTTDFYLNPQNNDNNAQSVRDQNNYNNQVTNNDTQNVRDQNHDNNQVKNDYYRSTKDDYLRYKLAEIFVFNDINSILQKFIIDENELILHKDDKDYVIGIDILHLSKQYIQFTNDLSEDLGLIQIKDIFEQNVSTIVKFQPYSGEEMYIDNYARIHKLRPIDIKNKLKTCHITKEFFQQAKNAIKSTIKEKDKKFIDEYAKNPSKFDVEAWKKSQHETQ